MKFLCTGRCFKVALKYVLIVALDLLSKIIRFFKMISLLRTSHSCIWNIYQFKCCMLKHKVTFNSIIKYSAVTNCNKYHWLMHFKYSNWFCLLKSCSIHVGWAKNEEILKKTPTRSKTPQFRKYWTQDQENNKLSLLGL